MDIGIRALAEFIESVEECIKRAEHLNNAIPKSKITDEVLKSKFAKAIGDFKKNTPAASKTVTDVSLEMMTYIQQKS